MTYLSRYLKASLFSLFLGVIFPTGSLANAIAIENAYICGSGNNSSQFVNIQGTEIWEGLMPGPGAHDYPWLGVTITNSPKNTSHTIEWDLKTTFSNRTRFAGWFWRVGIIDNNGKLNYIQDIVHDLHESASPSPWHTRGYHHWTFTALFEHPYSLRFLHLIPQASDGSIEVANLTVDGVPADFNLSSATEQCP